MKLKNCHIMFDFNRDQVSIVHRPGDGSPIEVKPSTGEFVHAMVNWLKEAEMGKGAIARLFRRIRLAVFGTAVFNRYLTGPDGTIYTVTLKSKTGKKKPVKEQNNGSETQNSEKTSASADNQQPG